MPTLPADASSSSLWDPLHSRVVGNIFTYSYSDYFDHKPFWVCSDISHEMPWSIVVSENCFQWWISVANNPGVPLCHVTDVPDNWNLCSQHRSYCLLHWESTFSYNVIYKMYISGIFQGSCPQTLSEVSGTMYRCQYTCHVGAGHMTSLRLRIKHTARLGQGKLCEIII